MAEIILPPEENEETPQVPELNIDKPTDNSKVITIEFEAKKTNKVSTKDTNQQLYTTDTDAWFEFKETSLEGANGTYSVVFRNRHDGSIFQRTGDVVNGVTYYKIPHQEIRHAGKWRGQLVYTLENGNTTAREFGYDVKGHILDGKDVREIVVEDFETLMSQLNSMKDNAEQELANLVNTAERNELERQQFYESLVEDINDLQENYQELLDTGVLQTNINEKLEELEEEYAPKLNEVTTQLAQMTNFNDYEIQNKTRKKEVLFTIIDDDGHADILKHLRPIQQDYNIPMTTSVITDWIGNSQRLSKEELLQLVNEGWEVSSHTDKHVQLDGMTLEEQYESMKNSVDTLEEWGIECSTICYPFNRKNEDTFLAARKLFRSGRSTDYGINRPPFETWDIKLINGKRGGSYPTFNELKEDLDDLIENGGWGVYITHAGNDYDEGVENPTAILKGVLDYILPKGVDVVTYNDALNRMGNIIDNGRYLKSDESMPHFVVGADGTMSSNTSPAMFKKYPYAKLEENTPPSFFDRGKIHTGLVIARNNFPDVGQVTVNALADRHVKREQSILTQTNLQYKRVEIDENTWGEWTSQDATVNIPQDSVDNNTTVYGFKTDVVTYCKIRNNVSGFPREERGLLVTYRNAPVISEHFQLFVTQRNKEKLIFKRMADNNGEGWTDWKNIQATLSLPNGSIRQEDFFSSGEMIFSATWDKPLWRNANNDGWVDADGSSVTP